MQAFLGELDLGRAPLKTPAGRLVLIHAYRSR